MRDAKGFVNCGRGLLIILGLLASGAGFAAEYYVDSVSGNDTVVAPTSATPWRTVNKVNNTALQPGDTVYFKAGGVWNEFLIPRSGIAGNPVSYASYGVGNKPRINWLSASGKSHVSVSGLSFSNSGTVLDLTSASNITVNNCDIHSTATRWSPSIALQTNSRYNRITNNTITQVAGNNDIINFRGNADYNLIEGNRITVSGIHAAIDLEGMSGKGTAHYNVIRNNIITGHEAGGALITMQANSSYNIVEGNILSGDSTVSAYCGTNTYARHQTMLKVVSENNIVRNNILRDYPCKDSLGLSLSAYVYSGFANMAAGNHVYGNVITGVLVGGTALNVGENGTGGKCYNNSFKNNIVFNNGGTWWQPNLDPASPPSSAEQQMNVQVSSNVYNNVFNNNVFYKANIAGLMWVNNSYYSVAQAQGWSPALYSGNLQLDPQLDPVTLRPLSGSPVKGAGAALTTVTSESGSGTVVAVADAYYFTDGLGLIPGDIVQIQGQRVAIRAINYATHTLTLAEPISWTKGDAVNLPHSGAAPDIGLLESTLPQPSPTPPPGDGESAVITAAASEGGTISPSGEVAVTSGAGQSFTITPSAGYYTASVTVDGQVVASNLGAYTYTFSNVTANHTISATFLHADVTVTASAGRYGTISPSGAVQVTYGASKTFAITPNSGYVVASVLVDGVNVGAVSSYTFTNLTANHTIAASFKRRPR